MGRGACYNRRAREDGRTPKKTPLGGSRYGSKLGKNWTDRSREEHAERHIPGFQAIEGVEVVSVCNRSRESGQRVADQFGIPKVFENWWDVVETMR